MSMGLLFKVPMSGTGTGESSKLLFNGSRIPREAFQAMGLADNVLREAEAAAEQLRKQTAAVLDAQRRQAHAEGVIQGRAQGMVAVLGTLEVERRLREVLCQRMADIVEHCVRSLLGELGATEVLRQRIVHLLRTAGMGSVSTTQDESSAPQETGLGTAILYVGPEQFAMTRHIVKELAQEVPGHVAGLSVVLDEKRAPDALLLETRLCFVDSNLDLTLQETHSLVQQALAYATQTMGEVK